MIRGRCWAGQRALIEASVVLNAALGAMTLRDDLEDMAVRFGVFDLESRRAELAEAPTDMEAYLRLAREVADLPFIRKIRAS